MSRLSELKAAGNRELGFSNSPITRVMEACLRGRTAGDRPLGWMMDPQTTERLAMIAGILAAGGWLLSRWVRRIGNLLRSLRGYLLRKQGRLPLGRSQIRDAAGTIVADYGECLERHPATMMAIIDAGRLPYPKETILNALCVVLASPNCSKEMRNALIVSADLLACFQERVGNDLDPIGDIARLRSATPEAAVELIMAQAADKPRYDRLMRQVLSDRQRIRNKVDAAITIGAAMAFG